MVYETGNATVDAAVRTVMDGDRLGRETALSLLEAPLADLEPAAAAVRDRFRGETVDTCSIVNAKSGGCPEDCGFCAQSAHYDTGIEASGFLDPEWMLETLGLELYLGAIVGMLGCGVLSFWFDLAGPIRRAL